MIGYPHNPGQSVVVSFIYEQGKFDWSILQLEDSFYRGSIVNFSMNEKIKKYLVPAIAGAAAIIGAIVLIIVIALSGSKIEQRKETKQEEKVKSEALDKCKGLMQQFLVYKDEGMDQEKLNEFYDRCVAECPDDFTPRERKEAPNSEKVRTRLAQRKAEKKVETCVNNDLNQSKGNKSANTVKPEIVVQPNDNKPELRPNPGEMKDVKSVVKKQEEDKADLASKNITDGKKGIVKKLDTKDIKKPDKNNGDESTNDKKQDKTSEEEKDAKSEKKDADIEDIKVPSPSEIREKHAKAWKECVDMIKSMLKPENLAVDCKKDEFSNRMKELMKDLLFRYYGWRSMVRDFLNGELLKLYRTDNVPKAQEEHKTYLSRFGMYVADAQAVEFTELGDYKFWRAVMTENWDEATKMLDKTTFFPSFVHEGMKANPEKIKLLKDLNDKQMEALLEYCRLDSARTYSSGKYKQVGVECLMAEEMAYYNRVAEQMRLLSEEIHEGFDFDIPKLPVKKSAREDLQEYFKDKPKTEKFEAAFKKLWEDRNLSIPLVMDATFELSNAADQLKLLKRVKNLRDEELEFDQALIDLAIASVNQQNLHERVRSCLITWDGDGKKDLSPIIMVLEKIIAHSKDQLYVGCATFYKIFIDLWKTLMSRMDKKCPNGCTLSTNLSGMAVHVSPFNIKYIGEEMSELGIGDHGAELINQSAECIRMKTELRDATEIDNVQNTFAQAYLKIYDAVKGAKMDLLFKDPPSQVHFLAVKQEVVADLMRSQKRIYEIRKQVPFPAFDLLTEKTIRLLNEKVLHALDNKLDDFKPPTGSRGFDKLETIFTISKGDKNVTLSLLDSCAVNEVIVELNFGKFLCEWSPEPVATPASREQVIEALDRYIASKTEDNKLEFLRVAKLYLPLRKQEIVSEIKTTLKL